MQLHWHTTGHDADKPLLTLHGFMGVGGDWLGLSDGLDGRRLIAPDLPGHGCSLNDDSAEFSMSAAAASVIALLDRLHVEQCALLGYSMGGRLALYLAVHYPQRVTHLILESSSPGIAAVADRDKRKAWDASIAARLRTEPFDAFLDSWYAMPLFATFRQHARYDAALAMRLQNDPRQLALSMEQMGTGSQPSLWAAWREIGLPTLLLVGEHDEKYVRISAEMHALNPAADRIVLPGLGHNTHFENGDLFAQTVNGWLAAN